LIFQNLDLVFDQQPEHRVSKAQCVSYTDVKLTSVRKKQSLPIFDCGFTLALIGVDKFTQISDMVMVLLGEQMQTEVEPAMTVSTQFLSTVPIEFWHGSEMVMGTAWISRYNEPFPAKLRLISFGPTWRHWLC